MKHMVLRPILSDARRRNQVAILGFEFLWGVGAAFVYASTVVAGYLEALGASKAAIGAIPAVLSLGSAVIQPLSVYLMPRGACRFKSVLTFFLLCPLGYAFMGLTALFMSGRFAKEAIVLTFVWLLLFMVLVSVGDPHYLSMVVESVSDEKRGRFFGFRLLLLGFGGVLGGPLCEAVLRCAPAPRNYGLCFLLGAVLYFTSVLWFRQYRDEATGRPIPRETPFAYLKRSIAVVSANRQLLVYLAAMALFAMAQTAFVFAGVYSKERLHAPDALLGRMTTAYMTSVLVLSPLLGFLADRVGYRLTMAASLGCYSLGLLGIAYGSFGWFGVAVSYFLLSTFMPSSSVVSYNLALEVAPGLRPASVGALLTITCAPFRMAAPILAGMFIDRWGYPHVFNACLLALVASGWLVLRVLQSKA